MRGKLTKRFIATLKPGPKPYEVYDEEDTGFLLRVQPSGAMTYFYMYRKANGKRARVKLGKTRDISPEVARKLAQKRRLDVHQDIDPAEAKKRPKQQTLQQFVEGPYQEWALAHRKTGREKVVRILGAFPELLGKGLGEITAWDIDQWRNKRSKEKVRGKTRKPGTLNRDLAYLKAALSKAVEWRHIAESPLRTVRMQREDRRPRERYLSKEEEAKLMAALDAREERFFQKRDTVIVWCRQEGIKPPPDLRSSGFYDHVKPLVITALHSGMRFGELTALQWDSVDFARNRITVQGPTAKSSQTRTIPMSRFLASTLRLWQAKTGGAGYVFESPRGGRLKDIRDVWRRILAEAEITGFRFHDCRHSFASRLVAAGVDLYVVKELLGHSTITVTERYSHVKESMKAEAVAALDIDPENVIDLKNVKSR